MSNRIVGRLAAGAAFQCTDSAALLAGGPKSLGSLVCSLQHTAYGFAASRLMQSIGSQDRAGG